MSGVLTLVQGSAFPSEPQQIDNVLVWELGSILPQTSIPIQFTVRVASRVGSVTQIVNVAHVQNQEGQQTTVITPSNRVDFPLDPSAVTLSSFTAQRRAKDIRIRWVTLSEIDTWSFAIYRANGLQTGHKPPPDAVKVMPQNILADGRGGAGATYEVIDTTASLQQSYTYWLVEVEVDGSENTYGPTQWVGAGRVYLPLALKIKG